MSNDPFYNRDRRIRNAMPCLLGIIVADEEQPYIMARSIMGAAHSCVERMNTPRILGKNPVGRAFKMKETIEAAIKLGFVSYSPELGLLELTHKGRRARERRHERREAEAQHRRLLST